MRRIGLCSKICLSCTHSRIGVERGGEGKGEGGGGRGCKEGKEVGGGVAEGRLLVSFLLWISPVV